VRSLKFYFREAPEDWDQHVHVFFVRKWQGEPVESEEMKPRWYKVSELPFDKMWVDDPHWLPRVLKGKKIEGEFFFNKTGDRIEKFNLKEI
jgi:hypothetical protein